MLGERVQDRPRPEISPVCRGQRTTKGRDTVLASRDISDRNDQSLLPETLANLTPEQVREVDRALSAVGAFGEVRLIKVKGRVRFIEQLKSRDLWRLVRD